MIMGAISVAKDGIRVQSVVMVEPSKNMGKGHTTVGHLGSPDYDLAMHQHRAYATAMQRAGISVFMYPATKEADSHFIEDMAGVFRDQYGDIHAIVAMPATPERAREVGYAIDILRDHLPASNIILPPKSTGAATLEFGDVVRFSGNVLVGLSNRSNAAGAAWLKDTLASINPNYTLSTVKVEGGLHADTCLSPLNSRMLIHDPAMPLPKSFGFETITLPHSEGYAASVLVVDSSTVIMPVDTNHEINGYKFTAGLLGNHYKRVLQVPMSEFHKMDGSLRCLKLALVWDSGPDVTLSYLAHPSQHIKSAVRQ